GHNPKCIPRSLGHEVRLHQYFITMLPTMRRSSFGDPVHVFSMRDECYFSGNTKAVLLTLEAMEDIERQAIEDIEGMAASLATTSPPTVQKPPGFVTAEKLRTPSGQE
ncbi:MAG: hypothetical protein ACKPKO_63265, partial [Candidatus Fonsibacter sp.]